PKGPVPTTPDAKQFKDIVTKYADDDEAKQRGGDLGFFDKESTRYPKKRGGGDLGFFDKESTRYPKEVVEAAFKLAEVGDVAPPIKTDKGFAVIRLTQKSPELSRRPADARRTTREH